MSQTMGAGQSPLRVLLGHEHGAANCLRQLDRNEIFFGVQVVLTGLVDDSYLTMLGRAFVGDELVELAQLQRCGIIHIANADDELTRVTFHSV